MIEEIKAYRCNKCKKIYIHESDAKECCLDKVDFKIIQKTVDDTIELMFNYFTKSETRTLEDVFYIEGGSFGMNDIEQLRLNIDKLELEYYKIKGEE